VARVMTSGKVKNVKDITMDNPQPSPKENSNDDFPWVQFTD